jgi:hypothetical protein
MLPYVQQVSLFARHFGKSPEVLGPEEIRSYQIYLTNERKLATGSILIAVSALRFLYKVTLHRDWCLEDIIPAAQEAAKVDGRTRCLPDPLCIDRNGCHSAGANPRSLRNYLKPCYDACYQPQRRNRFSDAERKPSHQ